jgi:hypothetical protein
MKHARWNNEAPYLCSNNFSYHYLIYDVNYKLKKGDSLPNQHNKPECTDNTIFQFTQQTSPILIVQFSKPGKTQ